MNKIVIAMFLSFPLLASAQTAAINGGIAVPITASPATSTTPGVTQPDGITILVNGAGGTSVSPVIGLRCGHGAGLADTGCVAGTDFVTPLGLSSAITAVTPTSIGASVAVAFPVVPLANYELAGGGSGTTAADTTGNGNTLTFGSGSPASPTWAANGIALAAGQGAAFPAALNATLTWCGYGLYTPLGLTAFNQSGGYPSLISSSLGSAANAITINLSYLGQFGLGLGASPGPGMFALDGYNNGGKTTTNQFISGETAWCFVEGKTANATLDTVYLNNATETYALQGAIGAIQTTGNLYLGASPTTWAAGMPNSIEQGLTAFSQQLTATQVAQVFAAYNNDAVNHGISFTAPITPATSPQLYAVGDSITAGLGVTSASIWAKNLVLTNSPVYNIVNVGIPAVLVAAESAAEPWRIAPNCGNQQNPTLVLFEGGTNDIATFSATTPQQIWGLIASAGKKYKAAGCLVGITPVISRIGNAGSGGTIETFRATLNNIERVQWVGIFDFIYDWAANPFLGATYADNAGSSSTTCTVSTYFQADCIHPTAAGDAFMATAASNAINYYSATNTIGNPLVLTATQTITLGSGQRYVDATACTACAITLPDGVGPTGGAYQIIDGAGTVTVLGQTLYGQAQTVTGNGSVGSTTAVTLPPGKTSVLTIVSLPQVTAGIKWVF